MGTEADAVVGFGIDIGTEVPQSVIDYCGFTGDNEDDVLDYLNAYEPGSERDWNARSKAMKEYPVAFVRYGYCDEPGWMIVVNGTEQTVYYGKCARLDTLMNPPSQEAIDRFTKWCQEAGVDSEPKWLVSALYSY